MAKNVVIIAGNIGAGKSTLVNYLKQRGNFLCVPEFIDKTWRNHFYADRKSYTAYFEKSCLMGRIARHITAKKHPGMVIFDRGLIEAREIFVQNSHDEGFLSFKQLNSYDHELREAIDYLGRTDEDAKQWMETLIVYLRAPPKLCFERQKLRVQQLKDEKELIPLEYFERIHEYYEKFITNSENVYKKWGIRHGPRIITIDASQHISQNPQYLEDIYKKIRVALNLRDVSIQKKLHIERKDAIISKKPQSLPHNNPPYQNNQNKNLKQSAPAQKGVNKK